MRKINLPAPRNSFPNSFTRPHTIYPRWATVRTGHWRLNWYALFSQFPHALEYVIETEPLDLIPSDEGVTLRLTCSQHKHRELADTIHAHAKYTDTRGRVRRARRAQWRVRPVQSVSHALTNQAETFHPKTCSLKKKKVKCIQGARRRIRERAQSDRQ